AGAELQFVFSSDEQFGGPRAFHRQLRFGVELRLVARPLLPRMLRPDRGRRREARNRGGGAMNQGPLIFLGVFFALALSWFGLVFEPQLQLGTAQQATNVVNPTQPYPPSRPGQARQALAVSRSSGCASFCTQP